MNARLCLGGLSGLLLLGSVGGTEPVIRLTSLEWPPYTGSRVEQQGASVAVVRAAAAAMGYSVEVRFYPWNRAVALVQNPDSGFVGYLPEYSSEDVAARFRLSAPIGHGPLGFVESTAAPVTWSTLADLQALRIGVVSGYVNTASFDAGVLAGQLSVDPVVDDAINVRKVAAGRIPLAVIDRHVLEHLLAHDPTLRLARGRVRFNARPLEEKSLHVAFQRSAQGEAAARIIDAGLARIDTTAITAGFFRSSAPD